MNEENIVLYSCNKVEVSESQDNSYMNVKFIICNFDVNKNNVMLNRETIDSWIETLIMKPIVGLIKTNKDNELDFTSHQAKKVYELINGQIQEKLKFGTDAFGVFDSVQIETIDDVEYITANCRIWRRFENCCKIIQDRFDNNEPLNTSWEISIVNSNKKSINGKMVKVINDGVFIGHALLSKYTSPAYDCSGMLEVAEEQEDEFVQAVINDLNEINKIEISKNKSKIIVEDEKEEISVQSDENSVENKLNKDNEGGHEIMTNGKKDNTELSALNSDDLRSKVISAIYATESGNRYYYGVIVYPYDYIAYAKLDSKDSISDDFTKFNFVINSDDSVSLTGQEDVKMVFVPKMENDDSLAEIQNKLDLANETLSKKETELSEKIDEIVKLGETITSQKETIDSKDAEISELQPLKEQIEKAEEEKKQAEMAEKREDLKKMALSSKYFTEAEIETSEELKKAIAELDEKQIKCLIAERVVEQASKIKDESKDETSEKSKNVDVEMSTDINANQKYDYKDSSSLLLNYARRNIKNK